MVKSLFFLFSSVLLYPHCVQAGFFNAFKKDHGNLKGIPSASLSNSQRIPLLGLDVGHLRGGEVETIVREGFGDGNKIRLVDTSHASGNEEEVAKGIVAGVAGVKKSGDVEGPLEVHVVTKVWYTHLGYDRTMLSVKESMQALDGAIQDSNIDLKVHLMIHWPRCYEAIEWMKCEQEENDLPASVKSAGPAPHLDKDNAWKESWKALEDVYKSDDFPMVASIGVSNFKNGDMKYLMENSKIQPHMVQLNAWSLLNDPQIVDMSNKYKAHIQVFDVMEGIFGKAQDAPNARSHLTKIAHEISSEGIRTSEAQTILKWLTQYEISTIQGDPAASISQIPNFSEVRQEAVAHAVEAILSGNDLEEDAHVKVTFHAKNQDMVLFYYPGPTPEDELMIAYIKEGESFEESTHPKHSFRVYSATDPEVYHDHEVVGSYGEHHHVHVEL